MRTDRVHAISFPAKLLLGASGVAGLALPHPALAAAPPAAAAAGDTANAPDQRIGNADDIVVTGTRVNKETPITASVHTFEPQAIVSRSIIEDSVPATADFSDVILLTPGASGTSNGGGPGLSESKTVLRGFQDGQYNITYDGIPFGDSNDPTHHSTAYFPDGTYERIIVDRGPGGATDLGQASYGGNVHLISRETRANPFAEAQLVYGSYRTALGRVTLNSGELHRLGDLRVIAVGEWKRTDTALTGSNAWFGNGFLKLEKPIGSDAKLSFVASYNQDLYHQSDNNGVSCTGAIKATGPGGPWPVTDGSNCVAGSQVGTYGKAYGLVVSNDPRFAPTLWTSARRDWNWTNKTTDFEIGRLQWNLSPRLTLDNKVYTYFYKNFTVSAEDTTTPCTGTFNPVTCGGYSAKAQGAGPGGGGGAAIKGDVPGYTKLNQYRTSGDVLALSWTTPLGVAKVGGWFEHSSSHRYRYDYDFSAAFTAGAIADGSFNFAQMAGFYNYKETDQAYQTMLNGQPVPAYIKYDEYTSWNQIQGFAEFALQLLDQRLTLTPGVKVQNFTRKIATPIAAQSTRAGVRAQDSYKPTLPYATLNLLIRPDLSVYAQYAKGFLIPSLGNSLETQIPAAGGGTQCQPGVTCNIQPTRTTNYQTGMVFAGDRVNIDIDGYYIKTSNSTSVDPSSGVATQIGSPAVYSGVEGQISLVAMRGLTLLANGSFMSSRDDASGLWLAQAPSMTATLGAVYAGPLFKLSYLHKFVGRQFADSPSCVAIAGVAAQPPGSFTAGSTYCTAGQLVRIAPYSQGTLAAGLNVGPGWLSAKVYNLFDDRSTTRIGGPAKTGNPATSGSVPLYFFQPGRSWQLEFKVRF